MAIMWSVPFDYNFFSNFYAMGIYDSKTCDCKLFDELYYSKSKDQFRRYQADNTRETYTDDDITISCKMTNSYEATLIIEVTNTDKTASQSG